MSNTTSLPNQVRIWLSQHPGFHSTREIATALDLETKSVSSAVSKLVKANRIVREDGKVADPSLTESEEQAGDEPDEAEDRTDADIARDEQAREHEEAIVDEAARKAEEAAREAEQEQADEATDEAPEEPETADEELNGTTVEEMASKKFDVEAMKAKIAKLLAKAERTDNEHERDTFNAAAEKMMLRLGIARAELESAGEVKPEEIVESTRDWTGNYSIVMVPFVHNVAVGFGNLTVLQSTASAMLRRTFVIGHKSDVEEFNALLDSLALQVMTALHRWQREHKEERRGLTDMEKYIQHRSFIAGFGQTVQSRLVAERNVEEEQASTGAALVLASKMDRIGSWMDEKYGEVKAAQGGMKYGSRTANEAGRVAGESANLGGTSVTGKKGELS